MTDKTQKYITVKDAAKLTGKSESTIKRIVRETKKNKPSYIANQKYFKFEILPTGHEKIFISRDFLKEFFNIQNPTTKQRSNEHSNERYDNTVNQELIEFLKTQLIEKDKQIEALIDRNKEINLLFAQAQQREQIKLEESIPKKRWWQRRK
jgi:hypothetical protein